MLNGTATTGFASEMHVASEFAKLGYVVSLPLTSCRYDWIVDTGSKLYRVQVKTARIEHGSPDGIKSKQRYSVYLSGKWKAANNTRRKPYTPGDFDYLCVVCGEDVYVIPVAELVQGYTLTKSVRPAQPGSKYARFKHAFSLA